MIKKIPEVADPDPRRPPDDEELYPAGYDIWLNSEYLNIKIFSYNKKVNYCLQ